ncbi:Hsp33 family molecular chaperone HslO [Pseudophaeobacter arcticus]|uniref:Hsp33 family molecular chaperone HslO n=1 Tax=Pseudophaeobacter arcticus TaxID=385492 RepID=UPI002492263E|nr:Hsp33 family molecular chaperone HslO [Pseudophaeobacter arcticus]
MSTETGQNQLDDDQVAAVEIAGGAVRGRIVRLGAALDTALCGDRYPEPVARLLGEAIIIAALVGRSLKFKGKLVVQTMGTNAGAVSMLVAECTTDGDLRAYARFDAARLKEIMLDSRNPGADVLIQGDGSEGGGTFAMSIDQGPDMERYQGLAAIEGPSLAACAEHYFEQSEQIPTRLGLAVGLLQVPGKAPQWRGGGLMVQRIAGDSARKSTDDEWDNAKAVMSTLSAAEILDPDLSSENLLYRLFHEMGVGRAAPQTLAAKCSCSRDRLLATLKTFDKAAQDEMMEDGKISANCEFCAKDYIFTPDDLNV